MLWYLTIFFFFLWRKILLKKGRKTPKRINKEKARKEKKEKPTPPTEGTRLKDYTGVHPIISFQPLQRSLALCNPQSLQFGAQNKIFSFARLYTWKEGSTWPSKTLLFISNQMDQHTRTDYHWWWWKHKGWVFVHLVIFLRWCVLYVGCQWADVARLVMSRAWALFQVRGDEPKLSFEFVY